MRASVYKRYLLAVLQVILISNTLDRVALGLLLQDIKIDLKLSDTDLGLLTGIAFAVFYSLMGIPIARAADRGNRVSIITITTGLWSAAVALCATAGNFVQLMLIRIGVAVGEAGCIPPAHSLIADHFSRDERPRAVALYMLGVPLSYVIGYFLAGWLNELYGWRLTFVLLGLPGVGLAALAWLTLKEPRRGNVRIEIEAAPSLQRASSKPLSVQPSVREVCLILWTNTTFRHLLFGYSVAAFFGYGVWQWKPVFFIRTYDLDTREVGNWLAAIYGACGLLGMYFGGEWASRRAARNERQQLRVIAIAYCSFGVISAGMYVASNHYLAFGLMGLATIGLYTVYGPLFATIQTLVPPHIRAMAIAIVYLFANLIGMGLGPLATGALSDLFRPWAGHESLRYALLTLCPGYVWVGWHVWRASRTVSRDLAAVRTDSTGVILQDSIGISTAGKTPATPSSLREARSALDKGGL